MNEIEKMYENAGIERTSAETHCLRCWHGTCVLSEKECKTKNKQKCKNFKGRIIDGKYPPFTAEKQIALIKWLSSKYGIYIVDKYSVGFVTCVREFCTQENFEDVLAESINHLWKDLSEEEKEQIKKILEG